MNKSLYTSLWFDNQAKEAADFYCSAFDDSRILSVNPTVTSFELAGYKLIGINGGRMFQLNASISLFAICETEAEIDSLWEKLSEGAKIMMPLSKYSWSEKYAFFQDKYNIAWQLMMATELPITQKIVPSLLFVGESFGKAKEAVDFYISVFPNSNLVIRTMYELAEIQSEGKVKYSKFILNGNEFSAMDGAGNHHFSFNGGMSFVVECDSQNEIDYYWDIFTKDGGQESQCGWCKDKFGVSWQIVPSILGKLMSDPEKGPRVIQAFLKMKKFVIQDLLDA